MAKREGYTKRMERNLATWTQRFEARRAEDRDTKGELEIWKVASETATAKLAELRLAAARYFAIRGELEATWQTIAGAMGPIEETAVAAPEVPRRKRAAGSIL